MFFIDLIYRGRSARSIYFHGSVKSCIDRYKKNYNCFNIISYYLKVVICKSITPFIYSTISKESHLFLRLRHKVKGSFVFVLHVYIVFVGWNLITKKKNTQSYGSWIYNCVCNHCLSPLMLWVRISIRARCTALCIKVSGLRQVSGFLWVLRFPAPIKLTATI